MRYFITLAALAGLAASAGTAIAQQPTPTAKPPAFIGDTGVIIQTSIGCENEADTKTFVNDYAKAAVAGDEVGQGNAVTAAFSAGCTQMSVGDTGLVIDSNGFLIGYNQIRMADGNAYWVQREAVGDVSGPMHHD